MLMEKLQQERLCIAVGCMASCRRSLDDTIAYVKQRQAFGKPIAAFQNTQFKLAELATEFEIGQAFVDKLLAAHVRGDEIVNEVSMGEVVDHRSAEAGHGRVSAAASAATASCRSTRSRATTPTPPCNRSTPAPTRS